LKNVRESVTAKYRAAVDTSTTAGIRERHRGKEGNVPRRARVALLYR